MNYKVIFILLIFTTSVYSQNDSDELDKLSLELLEISNTREMLQFSVQEFVDLEIRNNPSLADYKDILLDFAHRHLSFDSLKTDLVNLYTEDFTKEELRDLISFYETDLGKKTLEKLPKIFRKSIMISERRVQQNIEELQDLIAERQHEVLVNKLNQIDFYDIVSSDSTFSISIPENWATDIELVSEADFQAGDIDNDMFLFVYTEDKNYEGSDSLDNDIADVFNSVKNSIDSFEIIDSSEVVLHDLIHKRYTVQGILNEMNITYYYSFIKPKSKLFLIMGWTSTELADFTKGYFDKTIESFKVFTM